MCFNDFCAGASYLKDGYACFYADNNQLMTFLDEKFQIMIIGQNPEEYHIPALIDGEILQRCGYFTSFPHHLTVVGYVRKENYQDVVAQKEVKKEYTEVADKYLTPAACLHVYPMLEGRSITQKVITTKARVYRYEGENFKGLTRLWDFTVREIVLVGRKEFVISMQEELKQKALEFAQTITEKSKIVCANDPFYPSKQNILKANIQKENSQKFELLFPIQGEEVAVASFNYHDTHFSRAFSFDSDGQIVTGCVGFGLERWIAACIEYGYKA
jgi:seryl-tRNA synthetase